ncbi:MAG: FIVAR domain-containing protein, partial [Tannerella sp.]|nr:FIVAR domain-containing protein [Tannerella sp.]
MKTKALRLSIFIILSLSGIIRLHAERTTYYFTGKTDSLFTVARNWNTNRDGTGDELEASSMTQIATVNFIIPSRDTVFLTASYGGHSPITIENGGKLKHSGYIYVRGDTASLTVNQGGTLIGTSYLTLYPNARVTIAGKVEEGYIRANNKNGTARTVDVKKDGELTLTNGSYGFYYDLIRLINNGTIASTGSVSITSLEGQGILSFASSLTVSDLEASTFLQAGGGTVIYNNASSGVLVSSYNNIEIKNVDTDRSFTGTSTVYGNLSLTDNAGQVTLSDNITIAGNLTVAGSKVVTTGALSVAGDAAVSGLPEGSALNVTLNGTAQNIQGDYTNLEITAGSVATMTGDLTVENLVLVGTLLNPNNYTLTVTNQTGIEAYKTQLQIAISGASVLTEADYTVESWAVLSEVVSAARALLAEDATPTTVQLEDAKAAIATATAALVANLSVLESFVSTVKASYNNSTVYTPETYSALHSAIAAVETFLEEKTALTPGEVTAQKAIIDAAIAALVREIYTFYLLNNGTSSRALEYTAWNTERDGSGIQAVAFTPENTGHTWIIPADVAGDRSSIWHPGDIHFYGSRLIVEAGETTKYLILEHLYLHESDLIIEEGRYFQGSITTYGDGDSIWVKAGATINTASFGGDGGTVIVDADGTLGGSFGAGYKLEANGEVTLGSGQFSSLTGNGTIITTGGISFTDGANTSFLQDGGGTLVYRSANALLPSYNHVTIEEITVASTFSLGESEAYPAVPVYGNLLLANNRRRVTINNPLTVSGDFTVDYDIEDEAAIQATLTVSGNVSLSGLLQEEQSLHVTLSG